MARDLEQWQEISLAELWHQSEQKVKVTANSRERKHAVLGVINQHIQALKQAPKHYHPNGTGKITRPIMKIIREDSQNPIYGPCPVFSEQTICCGLQTLDAVENCPFACSYCTIQTFYGNEIVFKDNLKERLAAIKLDPNQFYHIGTGQSSDSLVWGNRNGLLDTLYSFADRNQNILLELKTKSSSTEHLRCHKLPPNVVCSWSLNTDTIITNEEHRCASLQQRLAAARATADTGAAVAFHFHPMVYYNNWAAEYENVAHQVQSLFTPDEVAFISIGSVTLIKPAIKRIRLRGEPTKILQMELVPDPHGRLTYPNDRKVELFRTLWEAFSSWHGKIYFYLCMEKREIWEQLWGWCYQNNQAFNQDFGQQVFKKLRLTIPPNCYKPMAP